MGEVRAEKKARTAKIAQRNADPLGGASALTDPTLTPAYVARAAYFWAAAAIGRPGQGSGRSGFRHPLKGAVLVPARLRPLSRRREGLRAWRFRLSGRR